MSVCAEQKLKLIRNAYLNIQLKIIIMTIEVEKELNKRT